MYESELFDLVGMSRQWEDLIQHLKKWRQDIPELPNINFDLETEASFEEIKDIRPSIFVKLFSHQELRDVVKILFPTGETLELLKDYFQSQNMSQHKEAAQSIDRYLQSRNTH